VGGIFLEQGREGGVTGVGQGILTAFSKLFYTVTVLRGGGSYSTRVKRKKKMREGEIVLFAYWEVDT